MSSRAEESRPPPLLEPDVNVAFIGSYCAVAEVADIVTEQFIGGVPNTHGKGSRRTFLARAGGAAAILAASAVLNTRMAAADGPKPALSGSNVVGAVTRRQRMVGHG